MAGTRVQAEVVRVVDGDTLRVKANDTEESLRILALDTEESHAGSSKPVTPWGHAAKAEAQRLVSPGDIVTLEFPGNEDIETCWKKYRGNFGRPLVFIYLANEIDYQEHMIRTGYSPYFTKYGYAAFIENHQRYITAERDAQQAFRGVWNQIAVNGSEIRNYARLSVWWTLRAEIIQQYRQVKTANPCEPLYNTRLDYEKLVELATAEEDAIIFTELRSFSRVGGGQHVIVSIGSIQQPFQVFIPNIDSENGTNILNLLTNRFIPGDDDHPRQSYAYVKGPLKMFGNRPEIIVTDPDQITGWANF